MTISKRGQAILAGVSTEFGGNGYTHVSAEVTVTATMCNGSLLKADFTEGAVADAATVVYVLDDPRFPTADTDGTPIAGQSLDFFAVGDVVQVRLAENNVIANGAILNFSDADYATTAPTLTAMAAKGVKVQSAVSEFEYL